MSLIRNSNKVKQVIDFTGVQNGNIHPSDIDAVFEFDNELLILIEVKYINTDIPIGQRLMLERICKSWHTDKGVVIKVEHNFDGDENIPLDSCKVTSCFLNKTNIWYKVDNVPFISFINKLGKRFNVEKCKF